MMAQAEAVRILASLHAAILHASATAAGRHFQGLGQVARAKELGLSSRTRRHVRTVDDALNLVRNITHFSAEELLVRLRRELAASAPALPDGFRVRDPDAPD